MLLACYESVNSESGRSALWVATTSNTLAEACAAAVLCLHGCWPMPSRTRTHGAAPRGPFLSSPNGLPCQHARQVRYNIQDSIVPCAAKRALAVNSRFIQKPEANAKTHNKAII